MPLYRIQDNDRPAFVVALCMADAVEKWRKNVAIENDESVDEIDEPKGVELVAEDRELIVGDDWEA